MGSEPITCSSARCAVTSPLYMLVIDTEDGHHVALYSWAVCRAHRFQLAELVSTRARFYRMLAQEFRDRDVAPPKPGRFDVEFERLTAGV